jgi:8-oxo-dGTP pyrophosphatase MutT (NUDIX family)/class 3 adenylate cyclase
VNGINNIMFIDIRGFTGWFNRVGLANAVAAPLLHNLYSQIKPHFTYTKFLGDGAMVLSKGQTTENGSKEDLLNLLDITKNISSEFSRKKLEISRGVGVDCDSLNLGFGIAKGLVGVIDLPDLEVAEFIGERIGLAARLCSHARPFGVIIDRESFRSLPTAYENEFFESEIKKIAGFSERRVWVSRDVSIDNGYESFESVEKLVEIHVTGLCTHKSKLLLAQRGANRDIYPNHWAGPGGRVKKSESFEDAIKRQFREEVGVEVNDVKLVSTYFIDTHRIPGLIFKCTIDSGVPKVKSEENQQVRYFSQDELDSIDMIPGLRTIAKQVLRKSH